MIYCERLCTKASAKCPKCECKPISPASETKWMEAVTLNHIVQLWPVTPKQKASEALKETAELGDTSVHYDYG